MKPAKATNTESETPMAKPSTVPSITGDAAVDTSLLQLCDILAEIAAAGPDTQGGDHGPCGDGEQIQ